MIEYETIINEIKEEIKTYYNEYCRYANLPDEKIDRKIELVEKVFDKTEKMENLIKEVMKRNSNQILANCFLPKNENERELVNVFNDILKLINKTLSEALNDE